MKTRLIVLLLGILFASISYAQTPVDMNGKLKLVGNQLSSECGNPVQLRGMSTHGVNYYPNCVDNTAFTSLKNDWNSDIVRIALYVEAYTATGGAAYYKPRIDSWVDQVGALGMYCIIDWHVLTNGDPNTDITAAKEFWGYMSKKHSGKKQVIYEICNEPNGGGVTWAVIKNYANVIIPIIRANDPESIIIVGTPNWSGAPLDVVNGGPLTGANAYNVMYTFHFYAASHAAYRPQVQSAAGSIPIFTTEWGLSSSTGDGTINTQEGQLWMDIFAGNNNGNQKISWCNWSFSDKSETSAALISGSCINSTWTNTTPSGTQVKTWISSPAKSFISCSGTPSCKAPNLGSDVSLCGNTAGITLNSGLSAANRTFVWKNGTTVLSATTPTILVNTAGTYTVTVDSAGCSNTDQIIVSSTQNAVNLGPNVDLCNPSSITLDAGLGANGASYAWTKDTKPVGSNSRYLTVNAAGSYVVTVSAAGCSNVTDQITVTSSLPSVTNDTICNGNTASLTAVGTGPFDWYTTLTGGSSVFTGPTYSPSPTSTTTYYVQTTPGKDYLMGPANKGTSYWNLVTTDYPTNDKQLVITALSNITLKSVDVDPQSGSQSVTINVTDLSTQTLVKSITQSIPAAQTTINVGANLISGKNYQIDAVGTTGSLYFMNQGAPWPQTTAGIATIGPNVSGYATGWSGFFNIVLSTGNACNRVPVSVVVNTCNGIEEETAALSAIKVYPNPFENGFNIIIGNGNGLIQKIELSDMEGRTIETRQRNQITEQMTMGETLPNGQYFLRIITDNKVVVKPVIKLK